MGFTLRVMNFKLIVCPVGLDTIEDTLFDGEVAIAKPDSPEVQAKLDAIEANKYHVVSALYVYKKNITLADLQSVDDSLSNDATTQLEGIVITVNKIPDDGDTKV